MNKYINIIAMLGFIYTQPIDLRINVSKNTMQLQNHQELIIRVQEKAEKN